MVLWFPLEDGISQATIPVIIVQGRQSPDFSKRKIAFSAYALEYNLTKNIINSRSVPVISLMVSNDTGG